MKVYSNADGNTFYYDSSTKQFVPLIQGETTITGKDGETYIFSGDGWLPQTNTVDRLKSSLNNTVKSVSSQLMQRGVIDPDTNFEIQQEGLVDERQTLPSPEFVQAAKETGGTVLGLS